MSEVEEQSNPSEGCKTVQIGPREVAIPDDWKDVPFEEAIELNPRYDKPDEGTFSYLPMDAVDEEKQTIEYWTERDKDDCTTTWFKEGDTVYAKITPCTENGKIAFIEEMDTEPGSGSTEFLVFHPCEGVTDEKFVYYLSNLPDFRAVTISLMEGSTGRQRVPSDVFKGFLHVPLPPLPEQRRIADILSTVDQQIHLTDDVMNRLQELRTGLVQDFMRTGYYQHNTTRHPIIGEYPADWEITELSKVSEVTMGSSPQSKYYNENGEGLPFFQGCADFGDRSPTITTWCTNPNKTASEGDILISVRAPVGDLNFATTDCCIGRGLAAINPTKLHPEFLYATLETTKPYLSSIASGSTFKSINSSELRSLSVLVPPADEQEKIGNTLKTVTELYLMEKQQKVTLQLLKRGLMQDLLTGKVRVNDISLEDN